MSLRTLRWLPTLTAFVALAGPALAVEQGDVAPPFKGVDFAGQPVEFPAVAGGKPAVVVFWATWCGYCKAFMPYLKNIQADYAAQDVKIVAINAKEDGRAGGGDPRSYVRGLGFSPVAVANGDAIAAAYGVQYIPGLLIVDGNGTVAYRRPWTDLPAGQTVAQLWDGQVRTALDALLRR